MSKYSEEFRYQAVKKALKQGIKPTVRELKISRDTLRKWIKDYNRMGRASFIEYRRPSTRFSKIIEDFVVHLKERKPTITLKQIQRITKQEKDIVLSSKGIHGILSRFGMTGKSLMPLKGENIAEIAKGMKLARSLLEQKDFEKTAEVLNSLPALSDFSILKKIPSQFLCIRRQAEQLEALWGSMPMAEMYEKARELRRGCEKKKLFFTGAFVATIEMNTLNFLGHCARVFSLYKRYCKYLPGLPPSLKYTFLMESFISYMNAPQKYPEEILKNFPYKLERFCSKLPKGNHRISWFDAMSACYQIVGEINKSLHWMDRLFQELSPGSKRDYFPEHLSLLSIKGDYSDIPDFCGRPAKMPTPLFLRASLAQSNALLVTGKPKEGLEVALNAFYKAEKEHLRPAMAGFTFFISCAYSALRERQKAKHYLKMSLHYSKNFEKIRNRCDLLLDFIQPGSYSFKDAWNYLTNLYLLACKTLRKRDYLKAYRFAEKKGLIGFLHRIILLHPEAIINLIRKAKKTYLPKEFLSLPIFKEILPRYRLYLLTDKESIFYGDREVNISPRSKDFHLLVYLFINRKKILDKETLINIFYKSASKPTRCLTKALSRIRKCLSLPKGVLTAKKIGVFFDTEAKIDLEELEERYKIGQISEKVGEFQHALNEYMPCFVLYKKSPFEKMGYYYNFAEERRMTVRSMFKNFCNVLLKDAAEKGEFKTVGIIKEKFKKEGLLSDSAKG